MQPNQITTSQTEKPQIDLMRSYDNHSKGMTIANNLVMSGYGRSAAMIKVWAHCFLEQYYVVTGNLSA